MDITFNPDQLKDLVSEAIMRSLDEQQRNTLIENAIKTLLTPTNQFGTRQSPLENAFHSGIRVVAERVAIEMLTNDDRVAAGIKLLINDALVKLFETNRETTVNKLADAIAAGLAYRER